MLEPGIHSVYKPGSEEIDPVFQILVITITDGFYIAACSGGYGFLLMYRTFSVSFNASPNICASCGIYLIRYTSSGFASTTLTVIFAVLPLAVVAVMVAVP